MRVRRPRGSLSPVGSQRRGGQHLRRGGGQSPAGAGTHQHCDPGLVSSLGSPFRHSSAVKGRWGVSSLPTPSCASDQPDALTEGRRRPEVRAVHRQPCLLGGTFIHSPILQMCVGPGAGSAALTQTNNVAALLEVTHSWDLETTHVLLITAALIC